MATSSKAVDQQKGHRESRSDLDLSAEFHLVYEQSVTDIVFYEPGEILWEVCLVLRGP